MSHSVRHAEFVLDLYRIFRLSHFMSDPDVSDAGSDPVVSEAVMSNAGASAKVSDSGTE